MQIKGLRIVVPLVALGVAILHSISPDRPKIDAIIVALLVMGLLPWISNLVETLKYGDLEIKLRKMEAKAEEAMGAAESARQLIIVQNEDSLPGHLEGTMAAVSPVGEGKEMEAMQRLVDDYRQTRKNNPPGDYRTALMTGIIRRMRTLAASIPQSQILPWLNDEDPARRLAAYAFLYARPAFAQVNALVKSVANRNNPPFAQYWGIMALQKIIGSRGQAKVSSETRAELKALLSRLSRGTDRHYELSRLLQSLEGQE
jgi:hypothetical protein